MKTPTTDSTEDQLKHLFATVAETAPMAPEVSDIVRGPGLRIAPIVERHRPVRWIASAAALAIALGGGLVWSIRGDSQNDAERSQSNESQSRLSNFLLPTAVPDGWQLVDITEKTEQPNQNASPLHAWVIDQSGGPSRGVLTVNGPVTFYGTTDTAATFVETDATMDGTQTSDPVSSLVPGDPTGDEVGTWSRDAYRNQSQLYWQVGDFYIVLSVNSVNEATVREMQSALRISFSATSAELQINEQSGYALDSDLGGVDTTPSPSASLVYSDADGKLIYLGVAETPAFQIDSLLDPTLNKAVAMAAVQPGADGAVTGSIESAGGTVSFLSSSGSNHTAAEAIAVLDSMVVVPESAWDDAVADIAGRISAEPVIGSGAVLGGELSIHDGELLDGICFVTAGASTCRSQPSNVVGPDSGEFVSVDLLVGDRWINVTRLPDGTSTDPVQIERMSGAEGFNCASEQPGPEPDCGRGIVDRAVVATDAGTFVVLSSPPGVTTLTVSVGDVDNRALAEQQFTRPLR